jgi:hypothetical protein
MKKSLLATVAAVALIAGAGMAPAQDKPAGAPGARGPATEMKSDSGRGAEMNRASDTRGGGAVRGETTGSSERSTTGASEMKADTKGSADTKASGSKADVKSSSDTKAGADKADTKSRTTGQGASEQRGAPSGRSANEKAGTTTEKSGAAGTKSNAAEKAGTSEKSSANPPASTSAQGQSGQNQAAAPASLTTEQKSTIRTSVLQSGSAPKVSRASVNFNISVGTVVPRTVRFAPLPPTLVTIYPMYRGYQYFVVDEEIIIVEPRTLRIVTIIVV